MFTFVQKHEFDVKKSRGVCETQQYAVAATNSKKAIFSFKVKVKVTRSLAKVKVDNRQTDKQTNRQTNRTKQYAPDHSIRGIKMSKQQICLLV